MNIKIIKTKIFSKEIISLIKKRSLLLADFENFKQSLSQNPTDGDLVRGTGGLRKSRLKAASAGKSGGFRVCYYYLVHQGFIFLLWIYAKNEQEDLTAAEKASLKSIIMTIKNGKNYE